MKHSVAWSRILAAVLALAAAPASFAQTYELTVGAVAETTVTLSWPVPDLILGYASSYEYDIRYRVGPTAPPDAWYLGEGWDAPETVNAGGEPSVFLGNTTETFTVDTLLPGTDYYFAIKVPIVRGTNWSYGEAMATTLPPDTGVPGTPVLISATATGTTVRVAWNAVSDDGHDPASGSVPVNTVAFVPEAQGIEISDQTFETLAHSEAGPSFMPGSLTEHFISGLQPHTLYRVALRSADVAGNLSPVSETLLVMTGAEPVSGGGGASRGGCSSSAPFRLGAAEDKGFPAGAGSLGWLLLLLAAGRATIGGCGAR